MTARSVPAATIPAISADGGLVRYLQDIKRFPVLEPEEEYMLAKRFQLHADADAAQRLVTSHLRLVAKMAMKYRHYGLPMADLISEGNVGLMRAVKKFDPEKGFRLATYAMWWIKASLNEFILDSWSLVRVGTLAARKKLFFNLRRVKAKLAIADQRDMSPAEVKQIATELSVPEDEVVAMNRRMGGRDVSLNTPVSTEQSSLELQDLLPDETPNQEMRLAEQQERSQGNRLLSEALQTLTERERAVIEARRLTDNPETLEEIGQRFGVSRERIRQIEVIAFKKLQEAVLARHAALA